MAHPLSDSASSTAFATATGAGTVETDPTSLAPNGFVGEGVSIFSINRSGIVEARGKA